MAMTQVVANATAAILDVNQIIQHLQGASLSNDAYHFRCSTGNNYLITLSDNVGSRKLSVRDSDAVEIMSLDSNGNLVLAGSISLGTMYFPTAATPSQTTDGQVVWDSDNDVLTVGDGLSRQTFYPGVSGVSIGTGWFNFG